MSQEKLEFPVPTDTVPSLPILHEQFPLLKKLISGESFEKAAKHTNGKQLLQELKNGLQQIDTRIETFETKLELLDTWMRSSSYLQLKKLVEEEEEEKERKKKEIIIEKPITIFPPIDDILVSSTEKKIKTSMQKKLDTHSDKCARSPKASPHLSRFNSIELEKVLLEETEKCSALGLWDYLDTYHYFCPIQKYMVKEQLSIENEDTPLDFSNTSGNSISSPSKSNISNHQLIKSISASHLPYNQSHHHLYYSKSHHLENLPNFEVDPAFSIPSVTQRVLSAFIPETPTLSSIETKASICFQSPMVDQNGETCWKSSEAMSFEQRMRVELRMIGLLDAKDEWINSELRNPEDDTLCVEIRRLQNELKQQISRNNRMKQELRSILVQASSSEIGLSPVEIEEGACVERKYKRVWKTRQDVIKKKRLKAKKIQNLQDEEFSVDAAYPRPKRIPLK